MSNSWVAPCLDFISFVFLFYKQRHSPRCSFWAKSVQTTYCCLCPWVLVFLAEVYISIYFCFSSKYCSSKFAPALLAHFLVQCLSLLFTTLPVWVKSVRITFVFCARGLWCIGTRTSKVAQCPLVRVIWRCPLVWNWDRVLINNPQYPPVSSFVSAFSPYRY